LEQREVVISIQVGKYLVGAGIDSNTLAVADELERYREEVTVHEYERVSWGNSKSSKKGRKKGASAW